MLRCALLTLVTGCQLVFPKHGDDDAGITGTQVCGGHSTAALTDLCVTAKPDDLQLISTIDTGDPDDPTAPDSCDQIVTQGDGSELCVVSGATIAVGTPILIGRRPLVLAASGDLTVDGELSVASRLLRRPGSGADFIGCLGGGLAGHDATTTVNGAGGGAGGSFTTSGGSGGTGNGSIIAGGSPAFDNAPLAIIRGGCAAGDGGKGNALTRGGVGGHGGGAIYLIANGTIRITGTIDASGSGGEGGRSSNANVAMGGGGGGGSGGLIGLDAQTVVITDTAILIANGGGGGAGGAGNASGTDGANGANSSDRDPTPYVAAGGSTTGAGQGGDGAAAFHAAINGSDNDAIGAGGGGGGGGVGAIVVAGALDLQPGAHLSPELPN